MAPIFVGSENENSRIRSDRLGFAASTSDPGTAAEGDGYYNSSDNKLKFYDGSAWSAIQGSGTVEMVASGTLSNGQTIVVTSDGKAAGISTTAVGVNTGSTATFDNATPYYNRAVYDASNQKVVVVYADTNDSNKGKIVIGTVSGSSITFGSPIGMSYDVVIPAVDIAYDSSEGLVILAYKSNGAGNGQVQYGTVSGNSISYSGTTVFEADDLDHISVDYDSNIDKFLIAYRAKNHSNRGHVIVGYNNGGTPAVGSEVVLDSGDPILYNTVVYHPAAKKMVVCYRNQSNYGVAKVATIDSSNSVSLSSGVTFNSNTTYYIAAAYDSNAEKVVIGYFDSSANSKAIVGTVSGSSISFGSATTVYTGNGAYQSMTYDANANKSLLLTSPDYDGNKPYVMVLSVSGDTVSVASSHRISNPSSPLLFTDIVYDSNAQKAVAIYSNQQTSVGNANVFTTPHIATNLTSENFIGFSDAAYSDGDTANIQIISSIDDAQSGLTTGSIHYVQTDGSLSTTAGSPSVEAGTALSDTKIRIKS